MKEHPILGADGAKLVLEDVEAGWRLAGTIDDDVRAQLTQVIPESADRAGYLVPDYDGPIVTRNGASGQVLVMPFQAYRSTLDSETGRDLLTTWFAGALESIPQPLPSSGNHRWDLLYAIVAESDGVAESRLVEDPATEDVAAQLIATRHRATVTLAWVQGTSAPTATNPYPAANFPALPAPASGQAHIPLAFIHVEYSATPATEEYGRARVRNCAPVALVNPQTGAPATRGGGIAMVGANAYAMNDAKAIATGFAGGESVVPGGDRTSYFLETPSAGFALWIALNFRNSAAIGASWQILNAPIFSPSAAHPVSRFSPNDWKNRWFMGSLAMSNNDGGTEWAHDISQSAGARNWPTRMPLGTTHPPFCSGLGNTIAPSAPWEVESGFSVTDWYVACIFRDVLGSGANNDMALIVRKTTFGAYTAGEMYLAVREATVGAIDGRKGVIKLDVSGQFYPFGL